MRDNREDKFLASAIFLALIALSVFVQDHDSKMFLQGSATTFGGVIAVLLRGQQQANSNITDSSVNVTNPTEAK